MSSMGQLLHCGPSMSKMIQNPYILPYKANGQGTNSKYPLQVSVSPAATLTDATHTGVPQPPNLDVGDP